MSLAAQGNKENFRLLDLTSEEDSEDFQLEIIPNKKKKITRRERSRGHPVKTPESNIGGDIRCALNWAMRGTLLLWMLMLTWICASLYDHISTMDLNIQDKVSTASRGVDDALQICHTVTKDLRASARNLSERLDTLEKKYIELDKTVKQATGELSAVSEQLSAAPKLADTPKRLAELQSIVAGFGSQINSFDGALSSARKQAVNAVSGVDEVKTMLHELESRTNETIAQVSATVKADEALKEQFLAMNVSLATKVDALLNKVEEMKKPASTVAPSTSSSTSTTTSTTPSTTTSTTVTTPLVPAGAPVKPNVLSTS